MAESCEEEQVDYFGYVPDEVLEHIFSFLSPYNDFKMAQLVTKRWNKVMLDVIALTRAHFARSVAERKIEWHHQPTNPSPVISERHSHSATYTDKSIYVFGGCTPSSTTFNDLWKYDLASRQWIRPLALGTYPSPKACASLVAYNEQLVLFGGWSHPTPYPLHQAARFFKELHVYNPTNSRWAMVIPHSVAGTLASPPGLAGHAATMFGKDMVVFGGSKGLGVSCDDVWVLDCDEMCWRHEETVGSHPHARYGHSQLRLDPQHMLITGGCGGPNMQFNDVWLLSMGELPWRWQEMTILQPENAPQQLWCHSACLVEDSVVVRVSQFF